jgi:hypothetical protein
MTQQVRIKHIWHDIEIIVCVMNISQIVFVLIINQFPNFTFLLISLIL